MCSEELDPRHQRSLQRELNKVKAELAKKCTELAEANAAKTAYQQEVSDLQSTLETVIEEKQTLGMRLHPFI